MYAKAIKVWEIPKVQINAETIKPFSNTQQLAGSSLPKVVMINSAIVRVQDSFLPPQD